MSEEIFEVVNERDEVMEERPRSEVHRLGLRHRAVHVLLFNGHGEVFLQQRSLRKDTHPGAWDSAASGHLIPGESYDDGARRELAEELGTLPGIKLIRLFKIDACAETGQEFVWVYRGLSEGPFHLNSEEIQGGGWFSPTKLNDWMRKRPSNFSPALLLIWQRFLAGTA